MASRRTPRKPLSAYDLLIGAIMQAKDCSEKQARKILLSRDNCIRIIKAAGGEVSDGK